MNTAEIERIGAEAAADEVPMQQEAGQVVPGVDLAEEFAEFLDMAANVAGVATGMPVAQRFTHDANVQIARQAIKVCEKYGYDARALLIGQDSALGVWLGLGVAVAVPGFAVYGDYKRVKALQQAANEERAGDGGKPGEETSK